MKDGEKEGNEERVTKKNKGKRGRTKDQKEMNEYEIEKQSGRNCETKDE
jgi:hypothetical protein